MHTSKAYRNSCTLPFRLDSVKTTYLDNAKPSGKLILKDIIKANMCGAMVIDATCTGSL